MTVLQYVMTVDLVKFKQKIKITESEYCQKWPKVKVVKLAIQSMMAIFTDFVNALAMIELRDISQVNSLLIFFRWTDTLKRIFLYMFRKEKRTIQTHLRIVSSVVFSSLR